MKTIPGQREKPFAFPPEIAFTLPRNPHERCAFVRFRTNFLQRCASSGTTVAL